MRPAYYIAFGAHGPRALPPPGEGWKVAGYTALGVVVSFAMFVAVRMGAKGSPGTMNKEYQEATNEFLKVCLYPLSFILGDGGREEFGGSDGKGLGKRAEKGEKRANMISAEPKLRPHLRYLVRRVQGQGNGAERAEEGINIPSSPAFLASRAEYFLCHRVDELRAVNCAYVIEGEKFDAMGAVLHKLVGEASCGWKKKCGGGEGGNCTKICLLRYACLLENGFRGLRKEETEVSFGFDVM